MAKGQKRGNREHKKPKQPKVKPPVAASPFALVTQKPNGAAVGRKR